MFSDAGILSRYRGELLTLAAFLIWGLMPLYFNQISHYSASTIFAVRVLTSIPLLLCTAYKAYGKSVTLCSAKNMGWAFAGAILISTSWFLNLWGSINGQLVAVSLAFFLSPIFTVVAAMVVFNEKLSRRQWVTFLLCVLAVIGYAIVSGELPWLTLVIASCFAGYGVVKRKGRFAALSGISAEIFLMLPVAIYLLLNDDMATFSLARDYKLLLITPAYFIPLILFGIGVKTVRQMTTVGMLNYIEPVAMYVLALTLFQEAVNPAKQVTMIVIWVAIAISFPFESFKRYRQVDELTTS